MTYEQFDNWLNKLKIAWEENKPENAVALCADNFIWHETPFSKPIKTKEDLLVEWQGVLDHENISFSYEILILNDKLGIASWNATFTRVVSKENVTLDGIFQVLLDKKGNCTEFHQWYNTK